MVMVVYWRRLCVIILCSELAKGATSETGKYLFRAASVWWKCAQYFVIYSCGKMPRDNRCMYMTHVCFYVCSSDCVGECLLCSGRCFKMVFFLVLECSSMLYVYVRGVMDVVFSVCIVTRGAVGARVWEV